MASKRSTAAFARETGAPVGRLNQEFFSLRHDISVTNLDRGYARKIQQFKFVFGMEPCTKIDR